MVRTDDRVVVVGAGLAGLVTAWELHQRGIPSVVLESGPVAGGRIGTIELAGGLRAEAHLEEFWASSPAYDLLQTIGLPLVEHPAASSFVADDELHLITDDGRCAFVGAGWPADVRHSFEHWNATARQIADELDERRLGGRWTERLQLLARTDLRSFVDDLGLASVVSAWVRLNVESETGVEWDHVATLDGVDDLRPFLVGADGRPSDRSYRIAGGNGRLVDALVERLPVGTVRCDAAVHRVVDDGNGVAVHYLTASGQQRSVRASYAVLTPPVWALAGIDLHPALDARASTAECARIAGTTMWRPGVAVPSVGAIDRRGAGVRLPTSRRSLAPCSRPLPLRRALTGAAQSPRPRADRWRHDGQQPLRRGHARGPPDGRLDQRPRAADGAVAPLRGLAGAVVDRDDTCEPGERQDPHDLHAVPPSRSTAVQNPVGRSVPLLSFRRDDGRVRST